MNLACNSLVTLNARRTDKVDGPGHKVRKRAAALGRGRQISKNVEFKRI